MSEPLLSKSKYLAGLQCPRRLWLGCFAAELATAPDDASVARLEAGTEIGHYAHALFPGGVLVDQEAWQHGEAVARTRALLEDPAVPAIFEAAFVHEGVRIRVDVLERLSGGAWGLREVKSSTRVKEEHLHDVAVQRFVLEGNWLRVPSLEIVHVDTSYVHDGTSIEWHRFFRRVDVTEQTASLMETLPPRVAALHHVLARPSAPSIEPSSHCHAPRTCEFWAHCTQGKPGDWVFHLPRLNPQQWGDLRAAQIERIVDIPDDFPLNATQARIRSVLRSGTDFVSPQLNRILQASGPPADYLDFETANPAIPLYRGTRPYEQLPFQWSLHRVSAGGIVSHSEFLADGRSDPRPDFIATLLAAISERNGPIIVYSPFEGRILDALGRAFPDRAAALAEVHDRLLDLLPIVRAHVYSAAFGGSFSIKAVAPALVRQFGYDDLDGIADGQQASSAFLVLAQRRAVDAREEHRLRAALLAYCERDTLAMVEVHRELRLCAGGGRR